MAMVSCSDMSGTDIRVPGNNGDSTQDSSHPTLREEQVSVNSVDLIQGIIDGRQKLSKSLFIEEILEVSFSKEGHRFYKVKWESTWESEDDLLNACKDILRSYWDNHIQFNIILDKAGYPKEDMTENGPSDITAADTSILDTQEIETSFLPHTEPEPIVFPLLDTDEKATSEDETKMEDIPEQYKNIGFAKSVRENFGQVLPSENKFDFVEHYLAEKSVVKTRNAMKKKARDETIRDLISYKNGTRVTCDICSESFADAKSLKNHKVCRHDFYSPHQCHICFKMFMKPGDVRRHMATHSPTRAHYCFFCEKTYKTKNHLQRHTKGKHPNLNITDSDILEQMLGTSDTDPNDMNQSIINITENDANSILTTETLDNSFNPNSSALNPNSNALNPNSNSLNSYGTLGSDSVNIFQDSLRNNSVVLHQPDLSETFLNGSADAIPPMCLIDKSEHFFHQFTSVNTLLQT